MTRFFGIAAVAALTATGAAGQTSGGDQPALKPSVETAILNGSGAKIGTATITGGPNATVIRIAIAAGGLPPGWHAAHFHAVADCSDPGSYTASKAHVNHGPAKHGLLNPEGPDEGDLPNLFAAGDGSVSAELSTRTKLDGRDGLRDADGSALIIHANADDHVSQPIGGAGARIACALVK
jgi:superoxide dismutase, Cu-Zn family